MARSMPLSWSATFSLVQPSAAGKRGLQGDKILLPQSSLKALLAASDRWSQTFAISGRSDAYSRAMQMQAVDERLPDESQQLPNPLTFQLVCGKSGKTVYAGIREFSAEEGEIALSPYLADALGIPEHGGGIGQEWQVTVNARPLPKGTYVRLQPLEAGYDADDWKALLERQLRGNFTTLTRGAILSVHGVKGEDFHLLVDELKPEGDGICVIDTDLEVDMEPLDQEQARETIRRIVAKAQPVTDSGKSSAGQTMDIWKDVDGQVLGGDYVDYELPSWDKSRAIMIELATIDPSDDVDLLVSPRSTRQRALPRVTQHVFADLSSPRDGVRRVVIQPTDRQLEGAEALLVTVHRLSLPGWEGGEPMRYRLRAKPVHAQERRDSQKDAGMPADPDEERCRNCQQSVPKRTMVLHESFCRRNNVSCPRCGEVFHKASQEWTDHWHCDTHRAVGSTSLSKAKHEYLYHTPHPCPACGPDMPHTSPSLPELARHRTTNCPHKLILCRFCHLEVAQEGDPFDPASEAETVLTGLTAHERSDGGRTTDCHLCGAILLLRKMTAHMAHHELNKVGRTAPRICRDELCGRTLHGIGPRGQIHDGHGRGNSLSLCSLCFAPLFVSTHDPDGRALGRRIERRYLAQLMRGCSKKWCANRYCRTGRTNLGLESWNASATAALQRVRPLMRCVGDGGEVMHFCVDETAQQRKAVADMLAAEGRYQLEWCVAALEAAGENLEGARDWLADWAPGRGDGGGK